MKTHFGHGKMMSAFVMASLGLAGAHSASAQVVTKGADGLYRNRSGGTFHSESSAQMDQMIQNNMAMNNAMMQIYVQDLQRQAATKAVGRSLIRSKRATTRFQRLAPFPMAYWIERCGGTTPDSARRVRQELTEQLQYWREESARRGVDQNDMAQMLALANVLAWEGYSGGKKATRQQFVAVTGAFRRYLLKDESFQGQSNTDKQRLAESNLINSTASIYNLRAAAKSGDATQKVKAKELGTNVLKQWFGGGKSQSFILTNAGISDRTKG